MDWRSTVRDGGVILFHDIAERENGFGVWRLWEEIAEPGRSFTFEHGHGLGVLAVGDVERLRFGRCSRRATRTPRGSAPTSNGSAR